jgi:hypothetical protein
MYTRTRNHLFAGAALFAIAAAPIAASAQQTLAPVRVTASVEHADRLAAQAESLSRELTGFKKAARLYEMSAAARGAGDVKAYANLRSAAFLRYDSGDKRAGLGLMEQAAERAATLGDVIAAANSYIDAAIIAGELKNGQRAQDLSRRAALLAKSPLLDGSQRSALLVRMDGWRAVTEVAMR